jgi:plastocyanin
MEVSQMKISHIAMLGVLLASAHAAVAETAEVGVAGLTFSPADVVITAGDSVHWSGLAGGFHTVAEVDDGSATTWNGGFHSPGGASEFTHLFDTPGVYYYVCEPHAGSGMRGTVTVEPGPEIPAASTWTLMPLAISVMVAGTVLLARTRKVAAPAR